ncbi:MAG: hypothetical protein V7L20_23045 [Nostoc sp.]|uniref:hypothetical protein n=1 Tax=Nostoc sp. TaxID=1180 RepID=UPI002FF60B96
MTLQVQILNNKFAKTLGLPFKELLPSSVIGQALSELKIKYYQRLFNPFVTLWAFLSQVLSTDKTCHNAVSKIIVDWERRNSNANLIYRTLLKVIAHKAVSVDAKRLVVRHRPARNEPRVRKRCPKAYPLMTKPRNELRKQLQTA